MKALVLLDGQPPEPSFAQAMASKAEYIVCADGAANWALPMGLRIDLLIGDMDSISSEYLQAFQNGAVKEYPREKDQTDGQLALDEVISQKADSIVFLGGIGGRVDHFLGHVQLLIRAQIRGVMAEMRDEKQCIKVVQAGTYTIDAPSFSLLPLGRDVRIGSLTGVQYPLYKESLPLDTPLGISNHVVEDHATLVVDNGWVLLVMFL